MANTLPQIPPTEADRPLQPFRRLGADRTGQGRGLGLGLSIVQAIADAHGAALTALPRPGGGLRVEVTFPALVPSHLNNTERAGLTPVSNGSVP